MLRIFFFNKRKYKKIGYRYGEEQHRFWPTDNPDDHDRKPSGGETTDFYDEDDYYYKNEVSNNYWDPYGAAEGAGTEVKTCPQKPYILL